MLWIEVIQVTSSAFDANFAPRTTIYIPSCLAQNLAQKSRHLTPVTEARSRSLVDRRHSPGVKRSSLVERLAVVVVTKSRRKMCSEMTWTTERSLNEAQMLEGHVDGFNNNLDDNFVYYFDFVIKIVKYIIIYK